MREAMRTARELVESLGQKQRALETQARDLEEARRRAEEANVAKAQFLATISHEIRTPMNGVLGATELLRDTPLDAEQRRLVETASHSAAALLVLIDDVLDLSRIEASKLTLQEKIFDLRALVHEAVDLMSITARDKPIVLSCTIARRLPERVVGDPMRLRQVLVNLLHNAVKFTERGRVVLEVRCSSAADGGAAALRRARHRHRHRRGPVRLGVRRLHPGRFVEHAPARRQRPRPGDRQAARRPDGRPVGVDSRVDEGSTFWLELSMKIGPPSAAPVPAPPSPGDRRRAAGAHPARRGRSGEPDGRERDAREARLHRRHRRDGEAACSAVAGARYDLVFMDCHMPVLDGLEATRRIRAQGPPGAPRTPIVALTADALAGDRERCLDAGMDDYMTKPVSSAQLAAAVRRHVGAA
jgi:CheY-like chemotaxis protein